MGRTTRGSRSSQRGETLVELLVAMSILGAGVVTLVGAIGANVVMTDVHDKKANSGAIMRTFAEAIQAGIQQDSSDGYVACGTSMAYTSPPDFARPEGYDADVTAVAYWDGKKFQASCPPDTGIQRLTLLVSSREADVKERLKVTIRQPCRAERACT